MDNVSNDKRSKTMKAVKSKNTTLELRVRKALWNRNVRYRVNNSSLYGKPDISVKKYKLVVFIDSCYWHGCPLHGRIPKSNTSFWEAKIQRNKERDKKVTNYYLEKGWNIVRVWEHEINEDLEAVVSKITDYIDY
ncbi:very short patch repair endonuclease [Alkalicoccus saliphilus]|uniref:Very short patch repair endonuclease n=1 Tax=Alkalicoccus saliphilus TaxID=200989 RepID=A0A2T4U1Y6_9BACI|nr:very short patch repair endonuclease [Alkalicoccus saliphilus]PTL37413.1 very short patch repair endonuclease [Alkalicoccus saliphilus]